MLDFREDIVIRVTRGNNVKQYREYCELLDAMRECDTLFDNDDTINMIKIYRPVSPTMMVEAYDLRRFS